jgi:glycosyltransferase involved in cell wall biosynthesis
VVWTRRSPGFRPQDIGWAWAAIADRAALGPRRPALWHQTDPGSPVSPLPMQRTIVTAYDLIPLHEPEVMARIRAHRRLVYKLYLNRLRRARMVVAISETTAADLVATLRIPRERIRVVYPVVEALTGRIRGPESAEVARVAPNDAGPSFLFVGIPDPHKRPDLAVAAFARFRAAHHAGRLTFVGYQPEAVRRRLREQSEACGVARDVEFADRVDDGVLAGMYASGVLLSLSRREGFGLPPVEALLTGGQAVAVPGAIYDEVLGDAGIRAESDDPDAIARAMLLACDTRPDSQAIERLRARYSPRATSMALRAVYDEVLEQMEAGAHAG